MFPAFRWGTPCMVWFATPIILAGLQRPFTVQGRVKAFQRCDAVAASRCARPASEAPEAGRVASRLIRAYSPASEARTSLLTTRGPPQRGCTTFMLESNVEGRTYFDVTPVQTLQHLERSLSARFTVNLSPPGRTGSRRGNNLKHFQDFCLWAKARIWP